MVKSRCFCCTSLPAVLKLWYAKRCMHVCRERLNISKWCMDIDNLGHVSLRFLISLYFHFFSKIENVPLFVVPRWFSSPDSSLTVILSNLQKYNSYWHQILLMWIVLRVFKSLISKQFKYRYWKIFHWSRFYKPAVCLASSMPYKYFCYWQKCHWW